jgi:outer membrane protein OmpA-like peptidoglycan-associated protein
VNHKLVAVSLPAILLLASCGISKDAKTASNAAKSAQQSAAMAQRSAQQSGQSAQLAQSAQRGVMASQMGATERQGQGGSKVLVISTGLLFAKDSSDVSPHARAKLHEVAGALKTEPQANSVIVEGYTDDTGTLAYNTALSERRAQAVADLLESDGIPKDRVTTQGLGPQNPVTQATTPEGRAMNRRVEIVIRPESQPRTEQGR